MARQFSRVPSFNQIRAKAHHQMNMVPHDGIGEQIDPHMTQPGGKPSAKPCFSFATVQQSFTTNAPRHHMEHAATGIRDEIRSGTSHNRRFYSGALQSICGCPLLPNILYCPTLIFVCRSGNLTTNQDAAHQRDAAEQTASLHNRIVHIYDFRASSRPSNFVIAAPLDRVNVKSASHLHGLADRIGRPEGSSAQIAR